MFGHLSNIFKLKLISSSNKIFKMSYLHEFQDLEDRVEGHAYLVWRRFNRFLPEVDVLTKLIVIQVI